jgi:hypothetical protein
MISGVTKASSTAMRRMAMINPSVMEASIECRDASADD